MTAYLTVIAGSIALGALFAAAGQALALGLHHPLPLRASACHACWLAVAVLVAAKFRALGAPPC